jgi:hypothetical protein
MDSFRTLVARDVSQPPTPWVYDLIIALLSLCVLGVFVLAGLIIWRKLRQSRNGSDATLPLYHSSRRNATKGRRLTITTNQGGRQSNIYVYDDKTSLAGNPSSPPLSPASVPEIRITFPDEHDEAGRPKSGRVVVVRLGETSVGLEPLRDEQLPVYEKESGAQFQSIDMESIGGLKEKTSWS